MSAQEEGSKSLADLIEDKSNFKTVHIDYIISLIKSADNNNEWGAIELNRLIILGESNSINIECNRPIRFEYCYFTGFLSLEDSVFEKFLEFKDCSFDHPIFLDNGDKTGATIKGDLKFINCFIRENKKGFGSFSLTGGTYETIYIAFNGHVRYRFISGTFKLIDIGSYDSSDKIESLSINYNENSFNSNSKFGDIKVRGKDFTNLYIAGINKGNVFAFEEIQVNNLHIHDFVNEGTLKFFGLNSLKSDVRKAYFAVEKSILGKAQFFRINFKSFDEVILIDSLITESTFVGIRWFNFVSPRQGPGYSDFDEKNRNNPYTRTELFQIREAYRQLKITLDKQGDKVQEGNFYEKEMNVYNNIIKWREHFWDKIILYSSDLFSKYGLSIWRPMFFLLIFNAIFCVIINRFTSHPLFFTTINNHSWNAVDYGIGFFFTLINPTHKIPEYASGTAIFWDLLSRISASFFLYNFIRATRRFVR